ncbi:MAG: (2Fe-2S) ferredoxin domain-containing protein [Bacteroidales bacterium]|jgi:NADP-reducing hydrogenase subunit HndB|nr:(2Fe-2S) ferredoxin domain-containing protein [Bacteroidales bacterium]MDD2570252.1 (2Fe-2S) ferredoxin domain-containing protein [Bacteroidales bacterium]MDD2811838.1 (2Fe-2S) ferredoxin domain-containing protein [Bacteroidales bacterium]MDD3384354.1 (2Fe-2S) ferredoxin domain-containing protein [Bacteroidales bacterium]MDD3810729.1 (2Fe-2S) ferredoxin domain-containing protein [Bacteroidales bacterium]
MTKVKTLADLKKLRENLQDKIHVRESGEHPESTIQVKVAMATCGIASGAKDVMTFFVEELEKRGINAIVTQTGCMGYCYAEPTVEVTLPGHAPLVFGYVNNRKADEIIEKYIKNGELVDGIIPELYHSIDETGKEK